MSLIDLFLDQDTESDRIRRLSRKIASRPKKDKANAALKRTRDDVGFLALAVLAAVKLMEEKGVFNEDEFVSRIVSLDKIDGLMDGKIEPDQLRQALGFKPGLRVTRKVRKTSRRKSPPEAKLIQAPREPHPKRTKTGKKRRASRSKTLAWKETGVPIPPAPAPEAPAPAMSESIPAAPPPPPVPMPDLELDIPTTSMDPATLGDINFDDYFGGAKKE